MTPQTHGKYNIQFLIAAFYQEPELTVIFRVLSLLIIFFALSIVQNSIIVKELISEQQ